MELLTDTNDMGAMSEAQQQLFFKEASDASYRANSNLTPEQQVRKPTDGGATTCLLRCTV